MISTITKPEKVHQKPDVTHIQIEPTTRCNFSCKFCYGRSLKQNDLTFDLFKKIIDLFPDTTFIELQGEGEPLLHPDFFEFAKLATVRGIRLSFITNGSLFNKESVDNILNVPFETITISIESPDHDKFKYIRGGNLDKVIQGIELLIKERNIRSLNKPAIGFSVTVLKDTKNDLLKIAGLYKQLGLDGGIHVQSLQKMPLYVNKYPDDIKNQLLSEKETIELIALTSKRFKILNFKEFRQIHIKRSTIPYFYESLFSGYKLFQRYYCPFLERGLFINSEGFVTPCCKIKDVKKFNLGKIGEDSYETIVAKRNQMQQELKQGIIRDICKGCLLEKRFKQVLTWVPITLRVLLKRSFS